MLNSIRGKILKVNYDTEGYVVDIPERNIESWIGNQHIKNATKTEDENKGGKTMETLKGKIKL